MLGLRKGEVLGLSWPDVDLDAGELSINLQLQRVKRELLHRETKTDASTATLPLPDICVAALAFQAKRQDDARIAAGEAWQGSRARVHHPLRDAVRAAELQPVLGLVFTTRYGTPFEPRNFNRSWDTRVKAAGVRRITVHDARRSCASMLAVLDVHPRVAMEILRHAESAVTMEIYTVVSSKDTREALKRLSDRLEA